MIHLHHAISLALIYINRATNGSVTMVSFDKVKEYERIVNHNLALMHSKLGLLTPDYLVDKDELFFTYAQNINEEYYYILKTTEDSINKKNNYMVTMPLDIVIASQKTNALAAIDLEKKDGIIRVKENKIKTLTKIK